MLVKSFFRLKMVKTFGVMKVMTSQEIIAESESHSSGKYALNYSLVEYQKLFFFFQTQFITLITMMFFTIILPATNILHGRLVQIK